MTNIEIINDYKRKNGIIEDIYTYTEWAKQGYQVKRGEKSMHKIEIYKHVKYSKTNLKTGEEEMKENFYLKTTAFFLPSQVEKID